MTGPNHIDPTPVRVSTNVSVDRQTPKTDFGDRVKTGLDSAAGAVANGAAAAAPFIPGGAIVSAAVSSVTTMSNNMTSGQQTASAARYSANAVYSAGSGTPLQTTSGTGSILPGETGTGTVAAGGGMSVDTQALINMQNDNAKLTNLQMAMQRENQVFSTVSNVLKTRHDTVKNTISNVR